MADGTVPLFCVFILFLNRCSCFSEDNYFSTVESLARNLYVGIKAKIACFNLTCT